MKKRKLAEYVSFIQGVNRTRADKQNNKDIVYYDTDSFDFDYNHLDYDNNSIELLSHTEQSLIEGDVIINNSVQLAAMVSKKNEGKVPSGNFIRVEFKNDELDKLYFIYLFNAYKNIKYQKERNLQGNMITRLTVKSLNDLLIPIVSIEEQKKIGEIYIHMMKLQSKMLRYSDLLQEFTIRVLENSLGEEFKDE